MTDIPVTYYSNSKRFVDNLDDDDDDDDDEDESDDDNHDPDGQKNISGSIEELHWFHGDISRNITEALLLSNGQEGSYLLRSSTSIPGKYSVSVKCQSSIKHYILEYDPYTKTYIFGLGQYDTLQELLEHFACQPVLGGESGSTITLKYPYSKNVEEPILYEEIFHHTERPNSLGTSSIPDFHIASKEGYLVKRGAIIKNWKRRWFVLQKNVLSYSKKKDSAEPIRRIDLRDAIQVNEDFTTDNKENCFRMCLPSRIFYFYADSHLEAKEWMDMLQWKINHYTAEKKKIREQALSELISFPILKGDSSSTSTAPSSKF